jgi:hypothetical protein
MQNDASPLTIARPCRLLIPKAMEGLFQTLDKTRVLLTLGHLALPLLLRPALMLAVAIERTETANEL